MIVFDKLHGLGNDFILVDAEAVFGLDQSELAVRLCNRSAIGADGLIAFSSDFALRIWNSDGSEASHCGNGLRCVARWLADLEPSASTWEVKLRGGPLTLARVGEEFQVQMDEPVLLGHEAGGERWSVRNPHLVLWRSAELAELRELSVQLDANVHSSEPCEDGIRVLTWERGAGSTQACGTGATAVAASWFLQNPDAPQATIRMPGGALRVTRDWRLSGPAVHVYRGVWPG